MDMLNTALNSRSMWDTYLQPPSGVSVVHQPHTDSLLMDQPRSNQHGDQIDHQQQQQQQQKQQVRDPGAPRDPARAHHNTEDMSEEVTTWLTSQGLSQETVGKLRDNGFTCKLAVSLITDADISQVGIRNLGQQRLLQAARQKLQDAHQAQQREAPQEQVDITQQLASLLQANNPQPKHTHVAGEQINFLAPLKKVKYLDVTDFVEKGIYSSQQDDQHCISSNDSFSVILKQAKTVKLEEVTPMQYMGASLRILMELLNSGELNNDKTLEYLGYLAKVSQLAEGHTWLSVLFYDRAYRQMQAQCGYSWGWDTPHLNTVHLKPRVPIVSRKPALGKPVQKSTSRPPCRLYNNRNGLCPYGDKCIYNHVCSQEGCGKNHPITHHPSLATSSPDVSYKSPVQGN